MFERFLPEQKDKFKDFYDIIKHRKCENILEIVDKFIDIIEKNNPKNYEILKEENKNFYS